MSQARVLVDLSYSLCFYGSGGFLNNSTTCLDVNRNSVGWVVIMLPSFWRMMQCLRRYYDLKDLPQLINAGKYLSNAVMELFSLLQREYNSSLFGVWVGLGIFGSLYAYAWDIRKDWGLCHGGRDTGFLRPRKILPNRWPYYVAVVTNLLGRTGWFLSVSSHSLGINLAQDLSRLIATAIEIVRRNQWNFYRLEHEHLYNMEHYRAVDLVPVPVPLTAEEDGDEVDTGHRRLDRIQAVGVAAEAVDVTAGDAAWVPTSLK